MEESVIVNRTYKDRLFKIIFEDKKELLNLYNALTGKDYQNPDELEINTLEDVIYIHLKNDVSFILDERQNFGYLMHFSNLQFLRMLKLLLICLILIMDIIWSS